MQNHSYLFATKRVRTNTYFERAPVGDRSRCGRGGGGRTKANLGIMRPTTGRSLSRYIIIKCPDVLLIPLLMGSDAITSQGIQLGGENRRRVKFLV